MATYIGNVTVTIGVRVEARSQDEADTLATALRFLADYIDMKNGVPLGKPFEPLDLPDNIEAGRYDDLLVNIETACRNRRILMEADGIEVPWEGEPITTPSA